MQAPNLSRRIDRCTPLMAESGIDVLLLARPANMYYLCGDGRLCAYLMVTRKGETALGIPSTDVSDVERLARVDSIAGFEDEVGMIHSIAHFLEHFDVHEGVLGLEYTFLTQAMMNMFTHPHAKPQETTVKDCTPILSTLRLVKEDMEVERIRAAARVAVVGMAAAIGAVREGATESQVAGEGEHAMRAAGADEFWRTYVSSGPRTNIAHGIPTQRRLERGDLVMIDMHPIVNGYSADVCRTVCVGEPSAEQEAAFDVYLRAQQETIAQARAGVTMDALEKTLHGIMRDAGHDEHIFGPPIHGVGIEFEEAPLPAAHAFFHGEKAAPPLESNVVIAVGNCGLYAGPWGVRVEDTLVITADGPELLTEYPRRLSL